VAVGTKYSWKILGMYENCVESGVGVFVGVGVGVFVGVEVLVGVAVAVRVDV
jgi:hypothetical protein